MGDGSVEDDDDDLVQVSHMVPESHRDAATEHTEYGGISDAVREVYRILAAGGTLEKARVKLQLDRIRNDRRRIEEQVSDLEMELDHLEERERELESRVDDADSREVRFEDTMADLDTIVQNGERVFPSHGKVERAAELSGMTPEEVISALRERNPDVPPSTFREKTDADEASDLL